MFNLFSSRTVETANGTQAREEFQRNGYVKLPDALAPEAVLWLRARAGELKQKATRRAFVMPKIATPRQLSTLGGRKIAQEDPTLVSLYTHHEVVALVRAIVGADIYRCQHEHEFMVVNYLTQKGDSHGWHLDDPAYALVILLEAPEAAEGGVLEFIPEWAQLCARWGVDGERDVASLVARARAEGLVQSRHHRAGDAYLLQAGSALHRVTPTNHAGANRTAINVAYQHVRHQSYGDTATALYADELLLGELEWSHEERMEARRDAGAKVGVEA